VGRLPRFQQLCAAQGIAPTYFTNWAVLDQPDARQTLLGLQKLGRLEIGMHIHPWNTPPLAAPARVTSRDTYLQNLDQDLILAKLEQLYRRFEDCGLAPTSFRGGRYSSSATIREFLQRRGFLADASVVPFTSWQDDGAPDYRDRDLAPVRHAPQGPGGQPLWEIPLTLGFTRRPFGWWARCYDAIAQSWLRRLRLIGIAERTRFIRKVWLNFEDTSAAVMLSFLNVLRGMQLPCICFTIHSSSLMAGKSSYTPTAAAEARVFAAMEEVFSTLAGWPEFQPATVSEVAISLENQYHARARH
jgi:hypothetical protein